MSMFDKLGVPKGIRPKLTGVFLLVSFVVASQGATCAQSQSSTVGVRLATRQFLTPDGAPYLEVQAEIMAQGLQWLMSNDSLYRAAVEWTVVAYDTTGAVAGVQQGHGQDWSAPLSWRFRGHRPHPIGSGAPRSRAHVV